jgi:hypothetical protein
MAISCHEPASGLTAKIHPKLAVAGAIAASNLLTTALPQAVAVSSADAEWPLLT